MRREQALERRRQQRRGRPFAGHVAQREAEIAARQLEVLEKVAADRPARDRRADHLDTLTDVPGVWQQSLLNLGRDPELLFEPPLLERLTIQPRVLDRDCRLRGERVDSGPRRRRQQRALFAAVQIQNADPFLFGRRARLVQVPDEPQGRTEHVSDAERDRAHVSVRQMAVEQVAHDPRLAGCEHAFGDLVARVEGLPWQRHLAPGTRQREVECAVRVGQHDERALGAGDLDRRVQDEREHFVEHVPRSERAKAFEQRRHLPQRFDCRHGPPAGAADRRSGFLDEKHQLGSAAPAQPDAIAVGQRPLRHAIAVHEGAVA